ncbi:hypothetical protein JQS43_00305 [Natronosporangium hydrolyticum]|uniref:Uncharacterized protein n=1 Tax=Natronosporangium hydrolyticum TaxID=2811111 RepID=A0A895YAU9_9ACTN|nr:hypothetical protein [Natronosporangium hydrolyticum]QSB14877.1 hypothetical protein JQS43_00305 [Natronosporangium hydrolyticum]
MSRHGPPREPGPPGPGDYGPPTDPWDAGGHPPERYDRGGYPPRGQEPVGHGPPGPPYADRPEYGGPEYGPPGYPDPGYPDPGYPDPGGFDQAGYPRGESYPDDRYADGRYDEPPYDERPYGDAPYGDAPHRDSPYRDEPDDDAAVTVVPGAGPGGPARRPVALYAVVTVLVLLAAVGVGYALYLLTGQDDEGGSGAVDQDVVPDPSATPDPDSPDFDNTGMNAAMARVDDCLVNDGSGLEPQMRIVACDAEEEAGQLFQVLEIVDEEVTDTGDAANEQAQEICADTEGYTHHYYEVAESSSFVLCMAEHDAAGDGDEAGGDDEDEAADDES